MGNIETMVSEALDRLVNIEHKVDGLSGVVASRPDLSGGYNGHPDQVFGGSTFAQHGDDLIILNIFHAIGINKPSYMDIGAHHPVNISNTALLYKLGSRGINIEPNPNLFAAFQQMRPDDLNLNVGVNDTDGLLTFYMIDHSSGRNSFDKKMVDEFVAAHPNFSITQEMEIEVLTVETIAKRHNILNFPDFLTIDVEGLDERILKSIDYSKFRPKLICFEYISGAGTDISASAGAFLTAKGYKKVFKSVGNVFYVDEQFSHLM